MAKTYKPALGAELVLAARTGGWEAVARCSAFGQSYHPTAVGSRALDKLGCVSSNRVLQIDLVELLHHLT